MTMPTTSSPIDRGSRHLRMNRFARPARPVSSSRCPASLGLALIWSLTPAMLGLVVASLGAGTPGLALLIFLVHQSIAWGLTLRRDLPIALAGRDWLTVAAVAGLTVAICFPAALGWLLLPVLPAIFLHVACRHGRPPCVRKLMHIFSLAAFAAVLTHVAGTGPTLGVIIAAAGAALLWLVALEKIFVPLITGQNGSSTED